MSAVAAVTTARHHALARHDRGSAEEFWTATILVAMVLLVPVVLVGAVVGSAVVTVSSGILVAGLAVLLGARMVLAAA